MTTASNTPDTVGEGRRPNWFVRIYRGQTSFDFVGRRWLWYGISGVVIIAGLVSLGVGRLNLGIEFRGGTSWVVTSKIGTNLSVADATAAVRSTGVVPAVVESLGTGKNREVQVQARLGADQNKKITAVQDALAKAASVDKNDVSYTSVGATWGSQITHKAIVAIIVFFVLVVAYISIFFEWKMAIAAFVAVIHDILVTVGVYSLFGFQVTPDTVVAILTILGYSLYDTVVVFDRIRANTRGLGATGRMTYQDVVNLSMNQTLARSINTSLVAILPVLSVLVIGAELLGASTLQYFGLALVIGLTSGAYSSIFIASPILSSLKEREQRYVSIRQKLESRSDRVGLLTPAAAAAMAGGPSGGLVAGAGARPGTQRRPASMPGRIQPGAGRARPAQPAATLRPKGKPQTARIRTAEDFAVDNGAAAPNGGDAEAGEAVATPPTTAVRPVGGPTRRPPQRPRKGKGKGGGRRR